MTRDIRLVVFDFDGTLSWIRHGWPSLFAQTVQREMPRRDGESDSSLHALLLDEILKLNGSPSIFQARRLVEMLRERGGASRYPETLCAEYQERLDGEIHKRIAEIRRGRARQDEYVVHGARSFLKHLRDRCTDFRLAILSTTRQERVIEEARVLGLTEFFGKQIYGGTGDPAKFSKRKIFEQLLHENNLEGSQLLSFGDGPVEIRETKALGGVAVAVCSDEEQNGSGRVDSTKARMLREAGADDAIPDYRDACALLEAWLCR